MLLRHGRSYCSPMQQTLELSAASWPQLLFEQWIFHISWGHSEIANFVRFGTLWDFPPKFALMCKHVIT